MKFPLFFENIFTLFAFINDFKGSRRSKRRLPSMAELINKSKEFLGVGQRKRRAQHFKFSTDPLTGFRSNTGTYSKRSRKGKKVANMWKILMVRVRIKINSEIFA